MDKAPIPGQPPLDCIEVLLNIASHSLTATPASILPFGHTQIKWNVSWRDQTLKRQIYLNGNAVGDSGSETVTPDSTKSFTLSYSCRGIQYQINSLTVDVDLSHCVVQSNNMVLHYLNEYLVQLATAAGFIFNSSNTNVAAVNQGTFQFSLPLYYRGTDRLPVVFVNLSATVGLALQPPPSPFLRATVKPVISMPVAYAGYSHGEVLHIMTLTAAEQLAAVNKLTTAQNLANEKLPQIIESVVHRLSALFIAPQHTRLENVKLLTDSQGVGMMQMTFCPALVIENL